MKKFEDFDTFLTSNNWLILLKKVERKYLVPQKIAGLHQGEDKKGIVEVAKRLLMRKYEFEVDCIDTQAAERWHKHIPNLIVVKAKI